MDFIHVAQYLTKLPEDLSAEDLFKQIETIRLTMDKRKFTAVLSAHRDAVSKQGEKAES